MKIQSFIFSFLFIHQIFAASALPHTWMDTLTGEKIRLDNQTNRLSIFVFVSTECPISNKYLPQLEGLHRRWKPSEVFLFLVYANKESKRDIRKHVTDFKIEIPGLIDANQKLAEASGVKVTPECAVWDKNGSLAYHGRIDDRFGALGQGSPEASQSNLLETVELILAGKAPATNYIPAIGCRIPLEPKRK